MAELDARAGTPVTSETDAVRQDSTTTWRGIVAGVAVVLVLGALTRFFETQVPRWADGTPVQRVAKSIEYPVYAIAL
ncbi:putative sulfate exporter family transporter, partial [Nocardia puris]|nr:putative sulfate exporter family transporter [Nocardia puris]